MNRVAVIAVLSCGACVAPTAGVGFDPVTSDLAVVDHDHPPVLHELTIESHGVSLSGFLLGANGAGPHPTVVLLHGYPGNEKNLDLAQSMRRAGFNVLFFHYRGAWGSQGDYAFLHLAEDVASALDYVRANQTRLRVDPKRLTIVGHSMGGFAALGAAQSDAEVRCVAGIAASNLGAYRDAEPARKERFKKYTDGLFMLSNFTGDAAIAEIEASGEAFDVRTFGPGLIGKSVLLVAGSEDPVVPAAVQSSIADAYRAAGVSVRADVIPGDHSFSATRIRLQRHVVDWLRQHCF